MQIITFLLLALSTSAQADTVNLGGAGKAEIILDDLGDNGAMVHIALPSGKAQDDGPLGQEFVPMLSDGAEHRLVRLDLDKDGAEEFFVRAIVPPSAGAVYVFRYNADKKEFVPLAFGDADYLTVDAAAPVRVGKDGRIVADIISKTSGKTRVDKVTWAFENGKFQKK